MGVWYTTREAVQRAGSTEDTAYNDTQVDAAIEAASRAIEGDLHRIFYPLTATRYFDWPDLNRSRPWRLWLDQHDLISVTTLTSGGTTVDAADYHLEPVNDGPPYTHVEIDLAGSASFNAGDTHQRAIVITGVWGHSADTAPAGALAEALDASETAVDVTNSALVGVGTLLLCDTERMIVTGKAMLDTGQNTGGALTASVADRTVPVTTGSAYSVGEEILIEAELMLIEVIAGNNLTVRRAYNGTVLASHLTNLDIYAPRTLTVERGAVGTTAATHLTATALTRHVVPGSVATLAVAEAVTILEQERSGYARTVGAGATGTGSFAVEARGAGLEHARTTARTRYGRRARKAAV